MNWNRHKKALQRTTLVFILCAIPIGYLAYQYKNRIDLNIEEFGVVPDFQLLFSNNPVGMNHNDTAKHLTIVAAVGNACDTGCPEFVAQMGEVQSYFERELSPKKDDKYAPRSARFIVQGTADDSVFPKGWDVALMMDDSPYLIPDVKKNEALPAFVLIDDGSFYRGFITPDTPNGMEKLKRELVRMTSNQYLYHYVSQQTLMWRRANGRDIKEKNNQTH
ncbi:MAG: hypothetical protein HRU19_06250 [Pseudobacteriovorax sp.]|nr:hypothetical protein [Pseudobacteriovorax sp.]